MVNLGCALEGCPNNTGGDKMRNIFVKLCLGLFLISSTAGCSTVPMHRQLPSGGSISALPTGSDWIRHVDLDLMPFWTMPSAFGVNMPGDFPTNRCYDGTPLIEKQPCPEFLPSEDPENSWIVDYLDRNYVRMKSRQIYLYSMAFHLTGNERYLSYARQGLDFLLENAFEENSMVPVTYWKGRERKPGPAVNQRTSQDLAYAQLGIATYYYITRDESVLKHILALKDHIFKNYYNKEWDMLMWVLEDSPDGDTPKQQELGTQLDQLNAYMVMLAPILPEPARTEWEKDLQKLANILIDKFYDKQNNIFWGAVHDPALKRLGTDDTDFGHSMKSFWMIYLVAKLVDDKRLEEFSLSNAAKLIERAYLKNNGSWGSRLNMDGTVNRDKEWWIYAELDQMTATMSLRNPDYVPILANTYKYWLQKLVDHEHHEVWHTVLDSNG